MREGGRRGGVGTRWLAWAIDECGVALIVHSLPCRTHKY